MQSYGNVSAGAPVVTVYRSDRFEVNFTVNFDTVNMLAVGKPAQVRFAARPETVLDGFVTEVGAHADQVSSFPVVLAVNDAPADVRAGMAVEVVLEFEVIDTPGYSIPLAALVDDVDPEEDNKAQVYVYDPETSTVKRRPIKIYGVKHNQILVAEGLKPGDRVASAGVPFLREGMRVNLLSTD